MTVAKCALVALSGVVLLASACASPVCDRGSGDCASAGGGSVAAGGGVAGTGGGTASAGGGTAATGGGTALGGGQGGGSAQGGGQGGGSALGGGQGGSGGGMATCQCGGSKPFCDMQAPVPTCSECLVDGDCGAGKPICNRGGFACVACMTDAQCGAGKVCGPTGACGVVPETCANALPLSGLAVGASVTFDVDTSMAVDDDEGTCNATAHGPERVYKVSVPGASRLTVTASRPSGSLANPVLYLRSSCAASSELSCSDNVSAPGADEVVRYVTTAAQDLFLFVEGRGANVGPTRVTVAIGPSNDDCSTASPLAFTGNLATASGNTDTANNSNGANDAAPTCSPSGISTGRDLVYSYTLTAAHDVDLTATAVGSTFKPVIYVRKPMACASPASTDELGCDSTGLHTGPARVHLENQAPGTYFVIVDSAQDTHGAFTLDVALAAPTLPPVNDTCTGPRALSFVGGIASVNDTTHLAHNDNLSTADSPSCSASATSSGKDVVFSYTLTAAQDVTITATPAVTAADYNPVVYVRKPGACTSGVTTDELACDNASDHAGAGTPASVSMIRQQPGTYFVWVDGALDTAGAFTLDVVLSAATPLPTNETCTTPATLTVGGPAVTGDTRMAVNDFSDASALSMACSGHEHASGDLVYQFTAATTGTVRATLTPGPSFDGVLLLMNPSCTPASCTQYRDLGSSGTEETLDITVSAGQTYYLIVDGWDGSEGPFSIKVQ